MTVSEVKSDVKAGFSVSFIITFIVAFILMNAILSIFDMFPYTNMVSAFIRSPVLTIKNKLSPPAAPTASS